MTHLKDASRLKGAICGNPALQGGGASDTRYPVWKTAPQDWMSSLPASPWSRHQHNSQVPPFRRVPSFRRPVLTYSPPALKGGVTITFAFQASHAFQASAVLLTQDTWVVPQKDYCLLKVFATAPFLIISSEYRQACGCSDPIWNRSRLLAQRRTMRRNSLHEVYRE